MRISEKGNIMIMPRDAYRSILCKFKRAFSQYRSHKEQSSGWGDIVNFFLMGKFTVGPVFLSVNKYIHLMGQTGK